MYTDGLTLLDGSEIKRESTGTNRGSVFPESPQDGQRFTLTGAGDPQPMVWSSLRNAWLDLVNLSATPYDIGLTIFDRPRSMDIVCKHFASRNFVINPNFEYSQIIALVAATEDYVMTINLIGTDAQVSKLGEIHFAAGAKVGNFVAENPNLKMVVLRGERVEVQAPEVRDATLKSMDLVLVGEMLLEEVV